MEEKKKTGKRGRTDLEIEIKDKDGWDWRGCKSSGICEGRAVIAKWLPQEIPETFRSIITRNKQNDSYYKPVKRVHVNDI